MKRCLLLMTMLCSIFWWEPRYELFAAEPSMPAPKVVVDNGPTAVIDGPSEVGIGCLSKWSTKGSQGKTFKWKVLPEIETPNYFVTADGAELIYASPTAKQITLLLIAVAADQADVAVQAVNVGQPKPQPDPPQPKPGPGPAPTPNPDQVKNVGYVICFYDGNQPSAGEATVRHYAADALRGKEGKSRWRAYDVRALSEKDAPESLKAYSEIIKGKKLPCGVVLDIDPKDETGLIIGIEDLPTNVDAFKGLLKKYGINAATMPSRN